MAGITAGRVLWKDNETEKCRPFIEARAWRRIFRARGGFVGCWRRAVFTHARYQPRAVDAPPTSGISFPHEQWQLMRPSRNVSPKGIWSQVLLLL